MSVNKVILLGRLGEKPELKTANGKSVTTFSLATNERWTDKDGTKQNKTEWHKCVAWGKQAELCTEYLDKGREVYIEGKIQSRTWEDKKGTRHFITEVSVQNITFLGESPMTGTEKPVVSKPAPKKAIPENKVYFDDLDFDDVGF